jgi:hypothetical protein
MNSAAIHGEIYHKGRTYVEHCAWLDSLTGDDYRIVHMPIGHLFNLAEASWLKRFLVTFSTTGDVRQKALNGLASMAFGPVSPEAIAAIEPADDTGKEIIRTITALPVSQQMTAFQKGDVFRLMAQLNPSLLTALKLCSWCDLDRRKMGDV